MATTSRSITLNNVMLSYCNLVEPVKKLSGEGMEYSTQIVISKDHPQLGELKKAFQDIAGQAFPDKPMGQLKLALRDNDKEGGSEKYDYLKNTMFMNVRRQTKKGQVPVVNRQAKRVMPLTTDVLFSGCIVNAQLSIYSYDMPTAKGITGSLEVLQIVDNVNVERLGNTVDVDNAFTALEEDEVLDKGPTLSVVKEGEPLPDSPAEEEMKEVKEVKEADLPW